MRTCNHVAGPRRVPTRTKLRSINVGTRQNHTDSVSTQVHGDIYYELPVEALDWSRGEELERNGEPSSVTLSDIPPRFDWRKRSYSKLKIKGNEEFKYVSRRIAEGDHFKSPEQNTQAEVYRNRYVFTQARIRSFCYLTLRIPFVEKIHASNCC